jgi:hypothetical protein
MNSNIKIFYLLLTLLLCFFAFGTDKTDSDLASARKQIEKGMLALYEYRIQDAEALSSSLAKSHPHLPAVRLLRAHYFWTLIVGGFNTETNRNHVFDELKSAEESLKFKPKKSSNEDLFAYISIKVMKARIHGLQGSQFKAFTELNSAVNDVKRSFGKESEFPYFKLSTGLYLFYRSYARDRYPFTAPYLMVLPSGNKEKGLQMLEEGFRSADPYMSCEAGYFLVKIMIDKKDYTAALDKTAILHSKYPNNLIFAYLTLNMAHKTGQHELAQKIYKKVLLTSPAEARYLSGQKEYFMVKMKELLDGKTTKADEKNRK